jgi:N-acetylglucosaminyldiphosphoundecaprenol N-acetyl-beta-D-mannosaminyltransferase
MTDVLPFNAQKPLEAIPRVRLLDANFHAITERDCVNLIIQAARERRGGWVVTHNLDHLRRLHKQREFRELCSTADLVVADGVPVLWAARLVGEPLPERVAGSDLIYSLSAAAADHGCSVFLLGGNPGTAQATASRLVERNPSLKVAGTFCPPVGFEHDPTQGAALEGLLLRAQPDIVFVGLGSPKQEQLIVRLRPLLPGAWWLGVGVSFSFVCGQVRRAPLWLQRLGLEWLHRLLQEPARLARRYLVQGVPFLGLLLAHGLRRRLSPPRPATQEHS